MARLFASVLVALLLPVPAGATLAVLVPSADGLVVAADSRISYLGAECDGAFKIVSLASPARTAVLVTGDSIFLLPPRSGQRSLCRYVATAPRLLNIVPLVSHYLEQHAADPAPPSLKDVGAVCVRAVERFRRSNPAALQAYTGKEIFSVILASYDPVSRQATLRNFVVRIDANTRHAEATRFATISVMPQDRSRMWIYGETAYVAANVYAGFGRQYLTLPTLNFLDGGAPVAEVPLHQAVAAAVNVIEAASRATQTVPAPSGIGGTVRVVLLGSDPRPEPLPAGPE
jgi:hypothetical protein